MPNYLNLLPTSTDIFFTTMFRSISAKYHFLFILDALIVMSRTSIAPPILLSLSQLITFKATASISHSYALFYELLIFINLHFYLVPLSNGGWSFFSYVFCILSLVLGS
jgi:hypothetical protein